MGSWGWLRFYPVQVPGWVPGSRVVLLAVGSSSYMGGSRVGSRVAGRFPGWRGWCRGGSRFPGGFPSGGADMLLTLAGFGVWGL